MVATRTLFRRDTVGQRARRRAMAYRTLLVVLSVVSGAEGRTFTSRADLRSAVDACLSNDATGQSCNMNLWDVSSVTSMYNMFDSSSIQRRHLCVEYQLCEGMSGMFYGATAFNGHICVGYQLCEQHVLHIWWGDIVQRGYLWLGHQLCDDYVRHIFRCNVVQRGHLWLEHQLCDDHERIALWGNIVQRGHLRVGHQLCDGHELHVSWGDIVQC